MCVVLNEGNSLVQTPREWPKCDLNPESLSGGRGYAVAACPLSSMTAEGGWALLFVAFMQGRLQHQGLGVGRESGLTCYSASVGGYPSRLLTKEGHLPHSTSGSREGDPVAWLETCRKCLGVHQ